MDAPKLLYAHRGASLLQPENTMEAFRQGLQDGATALEMDVHVTADDVVVVFHDPDGYRVARQPDQIAKTTFDQLQKWDLSTGFRAEYPGRVLPRRPFRAPKFEEVLEAFSGIPLNVDIKPNNLNAARLTIELIRKHQAQKRVRLTSFYRRPLKYIYDLGYEGPTGLSRFEILALRFLPESTLRNMNLRGSAAQVPVQSYGIRFDSSNFIKKCHNLGLRVDFWTINDRHVAKDLFEKGADGIMSDNPAAILPVYSQQ